MKRINRIKCGNGNCFLIEENGNATLVDTSRTRYRKKILEACRKTNVKLIILTHGHVDHIQNAAFLAKELNVPIAMSRLDYELTKNNMLEPLVADSFLGKLVLNLSIKAFEKDNIESFEPSFFVQEGDSLAEYGIDASIISLPGHTKGSIGINVWNTDLIVGDALMNIVYPTKSMLYGDFSNMEKSAQRISNMQCSNIHFGHGKSVKNRKW